jgi:hypothetical protein
VSEDFLLKAMEELRAERGASLLKQQAPQREELYGVQRAKEKPAPVEDGISRNLRIPREAVDHDPEHYRATEKQRQLTMPGQEAALQRPSGVLIANHPLDANEMRKSLTWSESIFGKGPGFWDVTGDYIDRGQHISALTQAWKVAYGLGDARDGVEFDHLRRTYPQVPEGGSRLAHLLGPAFEQLFGPRLTVLGGAAAGAAGTAPLGGLAGFCCVDCDRRTRHAYWRDH